MYWRWLPIMGSWPRMLRIRKSGLLLSLWCHRVTDLIRIVARLVLLWTHPVIYIRSVCISTYCLRVVCLRLDSMHVALNVHFCWHWPYSTPHFHSLVVQASGARTSHAVVFDNLASLIDFLLILQSGVVMIYGCSPFLVFVFVNELFQDDVLILLSRLLGLQHRYLNFLSIAI